MIGSVVGARYEVLSLLGQGAMGQVYLAEHLHLGRKEALKVLKPSIAVDPHFVARFRREARATNRVRHPNIVAVYDFGRLADGRLFLAMEYADGPSLSQLLLEEGVLPAKRAIFVVRQLVKAVRHAHELGVVHRDIKPSNLILTEHRGSTDFLKVLDFGMAKILEGDSNEPVVTLRGQTFGTPAYMAPEQFKESSRDPRVDLYSVGCVLYEMLAGRPPFEGHSLELMYAHERQDPQPPSAVTPDAEIPEELEALVMRCLEKDPDRRFQSAKQLLAALAVVPGAGKTPSQRRTFRGVAVPRPADDFKVDTDVSGEMPAVSEPDLFEADTADLSAEAYRLSFHVALRELAEGLRDEGADAVAPHLGKLEALRYESNDVDEETRWMEERLASVDRRIAERESSLRFALGELRFDREQASPELRVDLDYQIEQVEERLADLRQGAREEIDMLHDRGVHLAARRATLDEQLESVMAELREIVERVLPEYESDTELASRIDSYHQAKSTLDAIEGTD